MSLVLKPKRLLPMAGGLVALMAAGYLFVDRGFHEIPRSRDGEESKAKKTWSGVSFADWTTVRDVPSVSLSGAGFDEERVWSGYDDWEPAVGTDPGLPYVYHLTTRYSGPRACPRCPAPALILRRSPDGGATWDPDRFLARTSRTQHDPQIEVAGDGTLYVAWLRAFVPGVTFQKSLDEGTTWSTPLAFLERGGKPRFSDKPILAISPDGQDVYIAFNASHSYVVSSHDSGKSFSQPVRTNDDFRYWFHSGGAVAPDKAVYFAAVDFSQNFRGESHINVLKSTDGGASWTTSRVDTAQELPDCPWSDGCYFGFLGPSVALAIDLAGRIMIAYSAGDIPARPQKMYIRTSLDGRVWSQRLEVSNGSFGVHNLFPALVSGPTVGDFRVVWQDDRNGSTTAWNTWYRRTNDGGLTWSPAERLSDLGSGAPYKTGAGFRFPYGDYLEIAVDGNGTNHVIWGEGDSYTGPGGTWYTRGK
ncbi:MAG: sialidase family protein [Acidobacteriota bacterium]